MTHIIQILRQRLPINLLANFAGAGWSAMLGILFIPFYIQRLGVEAYGVIGFYAALQATLQILDFGLSPTLSREMARYSVQPDRSNEMIDLVRTLEVGYWIIGIGLGLILYLATPFVAQNWLQAVELNIETVQTALLSMSLLTILQWPVSLYQGGLIGLQKQVLLNSLLILNATLKNFGGALVLVVFMPTLSNFFAWQIGVALLYVILITLALWQALPRSKRSPQFNLALLRQIWRFAMGMSGIAVTTLLLTQIDKLILSKILSLRDFGYYILAGVISSGLTLLVTPIFSIVFPHLSSLVARQDTDRIRNFYHRSEQVMALLLLPVAGFVILFAQDIVFLWTEDAQITAQVSPILRLMAIGTTLNGLMTIPYSLQLAYGQAKMAFVISAMLLAVFVPFILISSIYFGAIGAATAWACFNLAYLLIGVPLTHAWLLRGETFRWYIEDTLPMLVTSLIVLFVARGMFMPAPSRLVNLVWLTAILSIAGFTSAITSSYARQWIRGVFGSGLTK